MYLIDSELQCLEELYDKLEVHLEKQYQDLKAHRLPGPDVQRETGTLEQQTIEAEKRIACVLRDLEADPETFASCRSRVASRASLLRVRARHLIELIERNAAGFSQIRSAAQESLRKLHVGGQFLRSVRGYREVRPKFIDARQ